MRVLVILLCLAGAAAAATMVRYGSLQPCDWLDQDAAKETGLPRVVAQAQIRAAFLLEGIADPTPGDCLTAWWDLKADGATAAAQQD